jgi:hypothetical protein
MRQRAASRRFSAPFPVVKGSQKCGGERRQIPADRDDNEITSDCDNNEIKSAANQQYTPVRNSQCRVKHNLIDGCRQYSKNYTRDMETRRQNVTICKGPIAMEVVRVVNAELVDASSGGNEGQEEGGPFELDTYAANGG